MKIHTHTHSLEQQKLSHNNSPLITAKPASLTLLPPPPPLASPPAALLTLLSVVAASGQRGRALNDFFPGSLEMSAPILSGCKRKGKREGGLKRISEAGGAGRKGGGGVAAEIYTAL